MLCWWFQWAREYTNEAYLCFHVIWAGVGTLVGRDLRRVRCPVKSTVGHKRDGDAAALADQLKGGSPLWPDQSPIRCLNRGLEGKNLVLFVSFHTSRSCPFCTPAAMVGNLGVVILAESWERENGDFFVLQFYYTIYGQRRGTNGASNVVWDVLLWLQEAHNAVSAQISSNHIPIK